jgi:hypothetical protein
MNDFEATLLRTAGEIKDLLSDGETHYWRECIDLAREHTGGHRSSASRIAFKAMSEFVAPHTVLLWGGIPGYRWLALYDEDEVVARVACPVCGVDAGEPCWRMNGHGRTGTPKSYPHDERQLAAYEPDPDGELVTLG